MNSWFRYFLGRSLMQRRGRFVLSAAAVALAVTLVTALGVISLGVRGKLGAELRQYGANMIVARQDGLPIDPDLADGIRSISPAVKDATAQLYGAAVINGRSVEIIGMEPVRMTGCRLEGIAPSGENDLMVGANLRGVLKVCPGDRVRFAGHPAEHRVSALFEKGSDEDNAVVMTIEGARRLLGIAGSSVVLLNTDTARLTQVSDLIHARWPSLEVRTLRQVAVAEERILEKIQLLMLLVTAVVLFSAAVALMSTMTATVIERMEEIGLMKAIGATPADIRRFFMSEAAFAGLAGSVGGCIAGILAAEAVSLAAFGSFVSVHVLVLPGSLLLGVGIAVLATALPVRDAMKTVPAQILRGE